VNEFHAGINDRANSESTAVLVDEVSELRAVLAVINRAVIRGLPGGVHGARARVIVEEGSFGSTITVRAGALALFTVISFGPDGNLQSIGAFEDLEPECIIEARQ
jgi:hypothetical protein